MAVPAKPTRSLAGTAPMTVATTSPYSIIATIIAPTAPRRSERPLGSRASTSFAAVPTDVWP